MSARSATARLARCLVAAGACGVLLAQLALPALHALDTSRVAPAAAGWQAPGAGSPPLARASLPRASHDPTTCPVCQSLLRSSPVLSSPAPRAELAIACAPALPAAPAGAWDAVALVGHPSRAPPARAFLA